MSVTENHVQNILVKASLDGAEDHVIPPVGSVTAAARRRARATSTRGLRVAAATLSITALVGGGLVTVRHLHEPDHGALAGAGAAAAVPNCADVDKGEGPASRAVTAATADYFKDWETFAKEDLPLCADEGQGVSDRASTLASVTWRAAGHAGLVVVQRTKYSPPKTRADLVDGTVIARPYGRLVSESRSSAGQVLVFESDVPERTAVAFDNAGDIATANDVHDGGTYALTEQDLASVALAALASNQ